MKERAAELKAQARGADGEADLMAKVGEMPDDERVLATKFHEMVKEVDPDLTSAPGTACGRTRATGRCSASSRAARR